MTEENKEPEESKAKCEEYLNGWKRERADFLNYKKEELERIGQLVEYANQKLILKILPILDNFCLAEKHPSTNSGQAVQEGVMQIKKQLEDLLAKEGIEPIETIGKPFDHNTMEVIEEIEKTDRLPMSIEAGAVVEEVQKGYTLRGKLIRPAKVKISK